MRKLALAVPLAVLGTIAGTTAYAGNLETGSQGEKLAVDVDVYPPKVSTKTVKRPAQFILHVAYLRPDGQPPRSPEVAKVRLERGIKLNPTAFPTCDEDKLKAEGPSACPAKSSVGQGKATLDLRPAVAEPIEADVKGFLGAPESGSKDYRLLFHAAYGGQALVIPAPVRSEPTSRYKSTIVLENPLPAGTPFALTRFDFDYIKTTVVKRVNGKNTRIPLIQAPATCKNNRWQFAIELNFAGGETLTARDEAPCTK